MDFRTRKFAGHLLTSENSTQSAHFQEYYQCLDGIRTLKNHILPKIISYTSSADFQKSGPQAAKTLYDQLKVRVFLNLPASCTRFKERLRRNVFFEVYDLLRNQWVRAEYLLQIATFLEIQSSSIQSAFLLNRLQPAVKIQILKSLKHRYTNESSRFLIAYLSNLLQELRNRMISNPRFTDAFWQFLQEFRVNPDIQEKYVRLMQFGWPQQVNRQIISIDPENLLQVLQQRFKIATSRTMNKKYAKNPEKVLERDQCLDLITQTEWNLDQLCTEAFTAEVQAWTKKTCISRLLHPSYSPVKVHKFTVDVFHQYILTKFRYYLRNIFTSHKSESIFQHFLGHTYSSNPIDELNTIWADLKIQLQNSLTIPMVRSRTVSIQFCEQLYSVKSSTDSNYPIRLHFTPYLRSKGFTLGVTPKTLARLAPFFSSTNDPRSFFATVPVLQLNSHKIIINQPIPMDTVEAISRPLSSSSAVIRGMGVDLGLKDFAVVSIFEEKRQTGQRQEIGRHFLNQRTVLGCRFDSNQLRFSPPFRQDYNIKRKLEYLRKEQRKLGSIWRQMGCDGAQKRTIKAYHRKCQYSAIWKKIRNIHTTLTQQIAHMLVSIALAYDVDWIFVEDLRWSQHSAKKQVGRWLAHNQQHFFFSQIITAVEYLCIGNPIRVKKVDAQWSSQICWTIQSEHDLCINYRTSKASIRPFLGQRTRKQFKYHASNLQYSWQGDSDLNAARNLVLRGLLTM